MANETLIVYTDGGARGNPGPGALGVFITDNTGQKIDAFGKTLGHTTNNVAEYQAVNAALSSLLDQPALLEKYSTIQFFLDSELIFSQITGRYKVKSESLALLLQEVNTKLQRLPLPYSFAHIPRAKNKEADRMVNLALDNAL